MNMDELKEYNFTISGVERKKIEYTDKVTKEDKHFYKRIILGDEGKLKFDQSELKKDGTTPKWLIQYKEFGFDIGTAVSAMVKEKPYKNKDGKDCMNRTIMYFQGDEHGVPFMKEAPQSTPQPEIPTITIDEELNNGFQGKAKTAGFDDDYQPPTVEENPATNWEKTKKESGLVETPEGYLTVEDLGPTTLEPTKEELDNVIKVEDLDF